MLCQLDLADVFNVLALHVTNARKKYSEEHSDYEEDYTSRYQPKLRQRQCVDYSKQLMPANFTQILERESKFLDRIMDASAEDRKSSRDFFPSQQMEVVIGHHLQLGYPIWESPHEDMSD